MSIAAYEHSGCLIVRLIEFEVRFPRYKCNLYDLRPYTHYGLRGATIGKVKPASSGKN